MKNESLLQKLFISHASEDKDAIARPLAEALVEAGFHVWFDEFSLDVGDSLKKEIDRGLSLADFGIVILSQSFFSKHWPQEELDGLAAIESLRRRKTVLPIWHGITLDEVTRHSPTLAGKIGIDSGRGVQAAVQAIVRALNRTNAFRSRADLDYGVVHVPTTEAIRGTRRHGYAMAAAAVTTPMHLAKIPGMSWEEFGQHLLTELRRLDKERETSEIDDGAM